MKFTQSAGWFHVCTLLLTSSLVGLSHGTMMAQILPDNTLPGESSVVTSGAAVQGLPTELIEGGARRNTNLFHSFWDFNVDFDQRVYFANPAATERIFSRVTGGNPSSIDGVLGVDGTASLYFLNPNGVIFGPAASLDVLGSFFVSTAQGIGFEDGSEFSTLGPNNSSLLTVSVPLGLQKGPAPREQSVVLNQGSLATGQDLTVFADQVDLQGPVISGGSLNLFGTDTVRIRDSVTVPFIAAAAGNLRIQGNETVDIVVLSHPDSGLYSGGDLLLQSANEVGGDAHFWSRGGFRVETLNGDAGNLFSPIDPIIRTFGDVVINEYEGASLHILAGGSVTLGTATITGSDPGILGIDAIREVIELSDGTLLAVDGLAQPTLDIRAGVRPEIIGDPPLEILTGFNPFTDIFFAPAFATPNPSTADISVGDARIEQPDGLILLTNQYFPQPTVLNSSISITGDGRFNDGLVVGTLNGESSNIVIDARNNVSVTDSVISTTALGDVGDITILANDEVDFISTNGRLTGVFSDVAANGTGNGGNIVIRASELMLAGGAQLSAALVGTGNGGNIFLAIANQSTIDGLNENNALVSGIFAEVSGPGAGTGGDIELNTRRLNVTNGAQISTSTNGIGDAGQIIIDVAETARFDGVNNATGIVSGAFSNVNRTGSGQGGVIQILANDLAVTNGAQLSSSVSGTGDAGDVMLEVAETVHFDGFDPQGNFPSAALSNINSDGEGTGGVVSITANQLDVTNGAAIAASSNGLGDAGSVIIAISDSMQVTGFNAANGRASDISSSIRFGGRGNGGLVDISANTLEVNNGSQIEGSTNGTGDAGTVVIDIAETARFDGFNPINFLGSGAFSNVNSDGVGNGSLVQISAGNLDVTNGAQLSALVFGQGQAGDVVLNVRETARFDGFNPNGNFPSAALTNIEPNAVGMGGDITITAANLDIVNGARVVASSDGIGNAGDVRIKVTDTIFISDSDPVSLSGIFSNLRKNGIGTGGDIVVSANNLEMSNAATISAFSDGDGDAGNIFLTVNNSFRADDSSILTNAENTAGGSITINATNVLLIGDSDIVTFVNIGASGGGDITFNGNAVIALDDSDILAFADDGRGGDITFNTAFFGENYVPGSPPPFNGNDRVDVNASGAIDGSITISDISFIENSLTELPDALVDPTTLTTGSCIVRTEENADSFITTGSDGLPLRPNDSASSRFSALPVQPLTNEDAPSLWHVDQPIVEPNVLHRLADGRLLLGRDCP
ncbi:filamentous hemagglutinin N-terminal domain-containing protein [Leptothoe sp. EHU-05/26/07-4]